MEVQKIKEFDVGVVQEVVQSLIQPKKEAYDVFERLEEINSEDEINPQ
jgi:predicted CopG family antitoxin